MPASAAQQGGLERDENKNVEDVTISPRWAELCWWGGEPGGRSASWVVGLAKTGASMLFQTVAGCWTLTTSGWSGNAAAKDGERSSGAAMNDGGGGGCELVWWSSCGPGRLTNTAAAAALLVTLILWRVDDVDKSVNLPNHNNSLFSCLPTLTAWHCPHSPAAVGTIDRHLLPAGPTAANLQQQTCCGPM